VLHPRVLPKADVIKIDVEGAEAAIVTHAELSGTSLILLEFQHRRHLDTIKAHLAEGFDVVFERREPWSAILSLDSYRQSLAGDEYGVVFLVRRGQTRLWRPPDAAVAAAVPPRSPKGTKGPLRRLEKFLRRIRESSVEGSKSDVKR
jgi:hypothetical protein